jgi:hypothetical protein
LNWKMDKSHLFLKLLNFFHLQEKIFHSRMNAQKRTKKKFSWCASRTDQHPHNHDYEYVRHSILSIIINIAHLLSQTFHSLLKKFLNSFVRKLKNLNVVDEWWLWRRRWRQKKSWWHIVCACLIHPHLD